MHTYVHIHIHHIHIYTVHTHLYIYRKTLPTPATNIFLSSASALIPLPFFQVVTICLLPDSFLCFKRWYTFCVFYLSNLLLGLENLRCTHKSITFRWRLPREDKMNSQIHWLQASLYFPGVFSQKSQSTRF